MAAKTRRLKAPWPFLYSVVRGRVVQNLPPPAKKPSRLRKVPPSNTWSQEALF